jgi:hypothetical protein
LHKIATTWDEKFMKKSIRREWLGKRKDGNEMDEKLFFKFSTMAYEASYFIQSLANNIQSIKM